MKIFIPFISISTALLLSEATYRSEIISKKDGMHVELKKISSYELEQRKECPNPEDIFPCTCEESYHVMNCSNVTTEKELRSIFSKPFPQDNLGTFIMDQYHIESNITYLGHGIFGTKTFSEIEFKHITFSINLDIFDLMTSTLNRLIIYVAPGMYSFVKDFSSFSALSSILLSGTSIRNYFVQSPSLHFLTLSWSDVTDESGNQPLYLGPMPELESLYLERGNLHIMPDISQYPMIREYHVESNYISYIGSEMVPYYLDRFFANDNDIEDIDDGSVKVNYGATVMFSNNELIFLDEAKWKNILINASHIELQGNPWLCGCEMAWIFGSDPEDTPFLSKLLGLESCSNGTLFTDLDPTYYDTNC